MRLHGIDYLRVCMNYSRCLIHTSIPYMLWVSPVWPVYDGGYLIFDVSVVGLHGFAMEIFFMISGLLAYLQFTRIPFKAFVKNRFKKLVIPFVCAILLFVPIVLSYFVIRDDGYTVFSLSLTDIMIIYQKGFYSMIEGVFITAHYWFLYYLILFYVIWLCTVRFKKIKKILNNFFTLISLEKYLLVYAFIVAFVSFLLMPKWIVLNPINLIVDPITFVYYGVFFFIGLKISRFKRFFEYFKSKYKYYLIGALLVFPIMAKLQEFFPVENLPNRSFYEFSAVFFHSIFTFFCLIGLTGFFLSKYNQKSNAYRYLSDASYTIYVVHLPVVMCCHLILQQFQMSILTKFLISLFISITLAHLIYEYVVRYTFLGDYLGKRKTRN